MGLTYPQSEVRLKEMKSERPRPPDSGQASSWAVVGSLGVQSTEGVLGKCILFRIRQSFDFCPAKAHCVSLKKSFAFFILKLQVGQVRKPAQDYNSNQNQGQASRPSAELTTQPLSSISPFYPCGGHETQRAPL